MEPFQWDLRGASDAGPSADAIFQGGADAEMFAAQMAQAPGQAIERGAQTLFGIVQARQQVAQQLAMEMQLAERQHAMRRDLSTMEFRQQLALQQAQDAEAMRRTMVGAQVDMERAQFSLQKEQEKQQQEQQAKDKLAGGQKYVEDLFGGALEMSTTPFEAMNYTDQSVQDMLGPNVDVSPLKAPFKGKYIPPEMQAAAVRALADAGEKDPGGYVANRVKALGAYTSEQDFKDAATSRAKTMVGQVQSKPQSSATSNVVDRPGLQSWREQPGDVTQYAGAFEDMPTTDPKAFAQLKLVSSSVIANDPQIRAIQNEALPVMRPGFKGDPDASAADAMAYKNERIAEREAAIMRTVFESLRPAQQAQAAAAEPQAQARSGPAPIPASGLTPVTFAARVAREAKADASMTNEKFLDLMETIAEEMGVDVNALSTEDRQLIIKLYEEQK